MKAKILKDFRDKYNGKIYKKGDTIVVSKARFDEIVKKDKSLIEEIKTASKETKANA